MTGIERLRELAWEQEERSWSSVGKVRGRMMLDIADQIERERAEDCHRMGFGYGTVSRVTADIERHILGNECMEDSPVARWARELREALGALHAPGFQKSRKVANSLTSHSDASDVSMSAYDLLPEEDREAIAWVRENGGLGAVQARVDTLQDTRDWLRERAGVSKYEIVDYDELLDALDRRLMPEGIEWPRYESGEPVRIGDVVSDVEVRSVVFRDGGILLSDCTSVPGWGTWRSYKEPIKRPVLAADGEPLEVGQTVWDENGDELVIGAIEDGGHTVACRYADVGDAIPVHGMWSPSDLTHQRPDSWQRIEDDATLSPEVYCHRNGIDISQKDGTEIFLADTVEPMARDLVRRARALAERERGE